VKKNRQFTILAPRKHTIFMYLFFDTETTGLPKNWKAPLTDLDNWPRMVQLAWLMYDKNMQLLDSQNFIIKPENYIIPEEVTKVHGITTERAEKDGQDLEMVLKIFADKISQSQLLVAHNFSFDEKIVGAEFLRKNIKSKLFDLPHTCTMESSTDFCAIPNRNGYYGYKWPRLSELHKKLFGEVFEEAHNAFVDVSACAKCFFELKELGVIR